MLYILTVLKNREKRHSGLSAPACRAAAAGSLARVGAFQKRLDGLLEIGRRLIEAPALTRDILLRAKPGAGIAFLLDVYRAPQTSITGTRGASAQRSW